MSSTWEEERQRDVGGERVGKAVDSTRHREPRQTDQGDVPAAQKWGLWTQAGLWDCSRREKRSCRHGATSKITLLPAQSTSKQDGEEGSVPNGLSPQSKAGSPDPQRPHPQHPKTQSWSGASALSHSHSWSGDKPPAWLCSPTKQLPALLMLYPGRGQGQCCPRTVRDARAPRAAKAHTAPSPTW